MREPIGYCPTCKREWFGRGECHCACCCEHFTSDSGFGAHRRNGECLDPNTLERDSGLPVFTRTRRLSGVAWRLYDEREPFWSAA